VGTAAYAHRNCAHILPAKQIDAAKSQERAYRLADSGGLFLFIPATGKKVWQLRYRFNGKEQILVIGPRPKVRRANQKRKVMVLCDTTDQSQRRACRLTEVVPVNSKAQLTVNIM